MQGCHRQLPVKAGDQLKEVTFKAVSTVRYHKFQQLYMCTIGHLTHMHKVHDNFYQPEDFSIALIDSGW